MACIEPPCLCLYWRSRLTTFLYSDYVHTTSFRPELPNLLRTVFSDCWAVLVLFTSEDAFWLVIIGPSLLAVGRAALYTDFFSLVGSVRIESATPNVTFQITVLLALPLSTPGSL